jgi:hypothetical protein
VLQLHGLRPGVRFNAHHRCPSADFSAMHKHASSDQRFNAATSSQTTGHSLSDADIVAGTTPRLRRHFWLIFGIVLAAALVVDTSLSLDSSAPLP